MSVSLEEVYAELNRLDANFRYGLIGTDEYAAKIGELMSFEEIADWMRTTARENRELRQRAEAAETRVRELELQLGIGVTSDSATLNTTDDMLRYPRK